MSLKLKLESNRYSVTRSYRYGQRNTRTVRER